jgi:hypothetical protein
MNVRHHLIRVALLFLTSLVTAYGARRTPLNQIGTTVTDLGSLVAALRTAGATVEMAGEVSQPFFSVEGRVIDVNGGDVHVFEYGSKAVASEEATLISCDGGTIGNASVIWVARPHFYRAGQVIALYVGDDDVAVAAVLGEVLGPPFAGRSRGMGP